MVVFLFWSFQLLRLAFFQFVIFSIISNISIIFYYHIFYYLYYLAILYVSMYLYLSSCFVFTLFYLGCFILFYIFLYIMLFSFRVCFVYSCFFGFLSFSLLFSLTFFWERFWQTMVPIWELHIFTKQKQPENSALACYEIRRKSKANDKTQIFCNIEGKQSDIQIL